MEIQKPNLDIAIWFAKVMHHGQEYDGKPYTYHLEQVEKTIRRFGFEEVELRVSAWLHDVIEDVPGVTYPKIKEGFGKEVADIVFCVTNQMGRNRREKFKYTYPKIKENKKSLIVKLADRISNIENGLGSGDSKYADMYRSEWPAFSDELFNSAEEDPRIKKMWDYLKVLFEGDKHE